MLNPSKRFIESITQRASSMLDKDSSSVDGVESLQIVNFPSRIVDNCSSLKAIDCLLSGVKTLHTCWWATEFQGKSCGGAPPQSASPTPNQDSLQVQLRKHSTQPIYASHLQFSRKPFCKIQSFFSFPLTSLRRTGFEQSDCDVLKRSKTLRKHQSSISRCAGRSFPVK